MLKKIDYVNKGKSQYICDRCGMPLNSTNRFQILEIVPNRRGGARKLYDLCEICDMIIKEEKVILEQLK